MQQIKRQLNVRATCTVGYPTDSSRLLRDHLLLRMSLNIDIVSDLSNTSISVRPETKWDHLGERLSELTGVDINDMKLIINDVPKNSVYLKDLRDSPVQNVHSITVVDVNENSVANQLKHDIANGTDVSFQYSTKDYEDRKDSVLQWKKDNRLGKYDPAYKAKMEQQLALSTEKAKQLEDKIGQRCCVSPSVEDSIPERRGWLRFVGKIPEINEQDVWCGVEFDEPVGKNDGSFRGTRYFGPVHANYGGFIKPLTLQVGSQFTPLLNDELAMTDDEL